MIFILRPPPITNLSSATFFNFPFSGGKISACDRFGITRTEALSFLVSERHEEEAVERGSLIPAT